MPTWGMLVIVGVLVVALIVMMFFSRRRAKKQEQETAELIAAVKAGNKVKTIGGICGIVVEVDSEENTFVLETGTETSGKCYIKFDKQAIYQTDAVVEKAEDKDNKPADEPFAETPAEKEETAPAEVKEQAEEKPAQEEVPAAEQPKAEAPAKKSKKK